MRRRTSPSSRQNMTPSRPWEKMTEIAAGSSRAGSPSTTASSSKAKGRPERPQAPMPTMARKSIQPPASIAARRTTITVDAPSARSIGNCVHPAVSASVPGSAGRSSVFRQGSSRLPVFATQRVEDRLVFASPQAAQQAAAEAEGRRPCGLRILAVAARRHSPAAVPTASAARIPAVQCPAAAVAGG